MSCELSGEVPANMAMFRSGSDRPFTTSTPFHQQHDSGFYENTPQSRNSSQTSAVENLESSDFSLLPRRKLFSKRRNVYENIGASSKKETPRTSRKLKQFTKAETPRQFPGLFTTTAFVPLKRFADNDSGFFETPERSRSSASESYRILFSKTIENLLPKNDVQIEESIALFINYLNVSLDKNYADLSAPEMLNLYYSYRFQRMGLKPSAADIDFCEKHLLISKVNEKENNILLAWKDRLEHISAGLEKPPKIDFLSQLHRMNSHFIIYKILSNLSGQNLTSASCVSRMWQKLVLEDKIANARRSCYLKEKQEFKKEREKKRFERPPNFRMLGSTENLQPNKQFQPKKTIKDISFNTFIEVGKSDNHKPMKCPSCGCLSLQDKRTITKCICLFCCYEFCCNCLKPYSNWHFCNSAYLPATKPPISSKRYLRRL